ncbi:uncharacterized protein N7511_004855 [Penicillium nucicola]|uniref:uncharacterized protein n=1 Tax=Penicillium nucicola TaxID=1850975 RepID=UPI00254552DA|nr:uncharacterized protein N7511_004855 [Penicillium nucicola]KAJ5767239.1 hypothetical protein N7511_004855 [Penicillium nucicola]
MPTENRKRAARAVCAFKGLVPRNREFRPYIPRRDKVVRSDFPELIERTKYMERILKRVIEGISLDTKSLGKLADALDADYHDKGGNPSDPQDDEGLRMDDEACTMEPVGDNTTHFSGEFSYWNFSMRIKSHIQSQIREPDTRVCITITVNMQVARLTKIKLQDPDHSSDFPRAHHLRPSNSHLSAAIASCPPRHIANFLVKIFFKYSETHYFLVQQSWILSKLDLLYNNPENFSHKGAEVTVAIILSVLAIGTQYAHLESLSQAPTSASGSTFSEDDVGTTFYQQAIRLLPEIIEIASLESVQACLLFGYYALPIDASGLGFIYINLAMRLGMQNGMHRKCKNEAFSRSMIETRNRVWWTAYVLERKISLFHGRPLSVLRSDVDANIPLYQASVQPQDCPGSITRAEISIQLVHFLEDTFHEINLLRNCQKQEISKIVSRLLTTKDALTNWWDSLPNEVVAVQAQQPEHIRSAMHLKLEYCLVRMFFGRPFLLKQETTHSNTNSPAHSEAFDGQSRLTDGSQNSTLGRNDLITDCIRAATEALDICRVLRDSGLGLARASYIEYSSCRASLLVLIAYSIQNFSEQFRKSLYEGLDMIREMSAAGESARSEVSLIESLERALARLHTGAQKVRPSEPQRDSMSDYEAFKSWGAYLAEKGKIGCSGSAPNASTSHASAAALPTGDVAAFGNQLDCMPEASSDLFNSFDPMIEMSIFGTENLSPSVGWPTYTEAQVLEHFLTNPHYGAG